MAPRQPQGDSKIVPIGALKRYKYNYLRSWDPQIFKICKENKGFAQPGPQILKICKENKGFELPKAPKASSDLPSLISIFYPSAPQN